MSCGCDNNGWGGCGCGNTVQYAPSACNPNFPTTCTALGQGNIVRVVGEDSSYCKYTVKPLLSNSLLTYNAGTASVAWNDGSLTNPIFLGSNYGSNITAGNFVIGATYSIYSVGTTDFTLIGASTNTVGVIFKATGIGSGSGVATQTSTNQAQQATVGAIQGTTPTGQLVALMPSSSTPVTYTSPAQFPIYNGSIVKYGTLETVIPSQGLIYKSGSFSSPANTIETLSTTTANQIVSFDTVTGDPIIVSASSLFGTSTSFIDVQKINIVPSVISGTTNLTINFGQIVLQTTPSGSGQFNTFVYTNNSPINLNINATGAFGLDQGSVAINTYYYVYAIYNPTTSTIATLCSIQPFSPAQLPTGYIYYRQIGLFRTNATGTGQIDSGYNQNGREVNLGASANQNVFSFTSTGANTTTYFSGQFSSSYPSGVNRAYLRVNGRRNVSGSTVYNICDVAVTNSQVGTTGATVTAIPLTTEIYGAAIWADLASSTTSIGSIIIPCFVPTSGNSFYSITNIYSFNTSGDFISINIKGYDLSIF